jgi:hypothetical protein
MYDVVEPGCLPAGASGSDRTYGSSNGNTLTCIYMNGNGAFVSYMQATAHVVSSGRVLQSCLHNPNGGRIGCTAFTYIAPGGTLPYTWAPHNYVSSGPYRALTWRKNNDDSTTEIGAVCLIVQ